MRIRSQDKTRLIKSDYIVIIKNEIRASTNLDGFLITIGEYSSQEKALKVLNMIEKGIEYKKGEGLESAIGAQEVNLIKNMVKLTLKMQIVEIYILLITTTFLAAKK